MDFVLTNHLRERNAQLGGAHRARERDHHFSPAIEMRNVGIGSILQDRGVEMPVMAINELADAAHFHFTNFFNGTTCFDAKFLLLQSSVNRDLQRNFYGTTARIRVASTPGIIPNKRTAAASAMTVLRCSRSGERESTRFVAGTANPSKKIAFNTIR